MPNFRLIYARLSGLLFRRRIEREMEEEMLFHLRMRAEANPAPGSSADEANREAIRRFGRIEIIREYCRDIKGGGMIETLLKDLRFGARMLAKKPAFTFVAVATLALGIGANTAIFSIVNAALIRPLPYPESDRLVVLTNEDLSPPDFLDIQAQNHVFEQMATRRSRTYNMSGGDRPERVDGADVTTNLFSLLKVNPVLGRTFLPEDAGRAVGRYAILSYNLWQRRYGGRNDILGRSLALDSQPFTIVGVMPSGFDYPDGAELWVSPRYSVPEHPLRPEKSPVADRGTHYFGDVIARLKLGVTLQKARTDLDTVTAQIAQQHPDSELTTNRPSLISMHENAVGDIRATLLVLFGVVTLVFLIACANVANLMLSRGVARRKELAIRAVLGASRARIVRQLLTESLLLAAVGGLIGILAAYLALHVFTDLAVKNFGSVAKPHIDATVLAFTCGLALLAALFFGLAPAFQDWRTQLTESIKAGGRSSSAGRSRYQEVLVAVEVALAVVLLVGAGLLLRSFISLQKVNTGLDSTNVLTLSISLPQSRYPKPESRVMFVNDIVRGIDEIPGVTRSSVVSRLPLNPGNSTRSIQIEGRTYPPGQDGESVAPDYIVVSPDYFAVTHIPLIAGREFTARDDQTNAKVVIFNKAAASLFFPNENPLGRRLVGENNNVAEIVGVVGDVTQHDLSRAPKPCVYVPYAQDPWPFMTVIAKTAINPSVLSADIERAIWAVDKDQAPANVRTMDEVIARNISPRRFNMLLVGLFAGLALLLAAIGIFGVTSFAVGQRTHEIGVRVALGAERSRILGLVVGRSLILTIIGALAGIAGALVLTRLMLSMLFGVHPWDPVTMIAVPLLLIASTMLASYLPARRAMRVDPAVALRYE